MRWFNTGLRLAVLSFCVAGLAGCMEDNEAFIKQQAATAKNTIPGSRTAQAQTLEEYYEITPGLRGAGLRQGPVPDQGAGYPSAKSTTASSSLMRLASPRSAQGTPSPGTKR
jgi:hypothetical protein